LVKSEELLLKLLREKLSYGIIDFLDAFFFLAEEVGEYCAHFLVKRPLK